MKKSVDKHFFLCYIPSNPIKHIGNTKKKKGDNIMKNFVVIRNFNVVNDMCCCSFVCMSRTMVYFHACCLPSV